MGSVVIVVWRVKGKLKSGLGYNSVELMMRWERVCVCACVWW